MNVPSRDCAGAGNQRSRCLGQGGRPRSEKAWSGKSSERRDAQCGAQTLRDALRSQEMSRWQEVWAGDAQVRSGNEGPTCLRTKKKKQTIKQKQYCNKFNKSFNKWSTSKNPKNKKMIPLDINHSQGFKSHTYCTYLEWLTLRVWWLNRYSASVRLTLHFIF